MLLIGEDNMSSIGDISSSYYDFSSIYGNTTSVGKTSADKLVNNLDNLNVEDASDEELLEACKSFETYFIEQVLKEAKKTIKDEDEKENQYLEYFGDNMIQEYAGMISERGDLGIAQSLYESMKRNGNS